MQTTEDLIRPILIESLNDLSKLLAAKIDHYPDHYLADLIYGELWRYFRDPDNLDQIAAKIEAALRERENEQDD
jgi:hypothetical protein